MTCLYVFSAVFITSLDDLIISVCLYVFSAVFTTGLDEPIINVSPAEVVLGDRMEIVCSFLIPVNESHIMTLMRNEETLEERLYGELRKGISSNGKSCARISHVVEKVTLSDAGVYKCRSFGIHERNHHWETDYHIQIFCKFEYFISIYFHVKFNSVYIFLLSNFTYK